MATAEEVIAWLDAHGSGQRLHMESEVGTTPVDELILAWSANMTVLQAAIDRGATMVCARTNCYYAPPVGFDQAIVPGELDWEDIVGADPVMRAKREFVQQHGLVVTAAPWLWDIGGPNARSAALARAIELGDVLDDGPTVTVQPSKQFSTADIVESLCSKLGTTHCLVTGHTDLAHRIAVVAGMCSPYDVATALVDDQVDVLITGESVEWEAVPYAQDVIQTGRQFSLIAAGNAISENPAAFALARLLNADDPPVRVTAMPVTPPAWVARKVVA